MLQSPEVYGIFDDAPLGAVALTCSGTPADFRNSTNTGRLPSKHLLTKHFSAKFDVVPDPPPVRVPYPPSSTLKVNPNVAWCNL